MCQTLLSLISHLLLSSMKGVVLAEHLAHCFSLVQSVFLTDKNWKHLSRLHQSSRQSSNGTGLEKLELALHSAL